MKFKYRSICFGVFFVLCLSIVTSPAAGEPVNMLSLQEGTMAVIVPPTYSGWDAENLLNESVESGWACEDKHINNNVFVFELVGETTFEGFEFDNVAVDTEKSAAKDILVEVSTSSAKDGFSPVLEATLADVTPKQVFPASTKTPARWVRLTIKNNYGSPDYTELFSFKGFGERPVVATPENISGTYDTDYSKFHVLQQGTALTGCYEYQEGLLDGAIEGRVMKITWKEAGGPDNRGPAIMVFSEDGKSFRGFWWYTGREKRAPNGKWDGKKVSNKVGGCPHWAGSVGGELQKQLSEEKRARIYGILFDTNSAKIKAESKPVLEEVLELLRQESSWNLTIEGHTDAVGSDEHNQTLSQQRADSVKAWLVAGGVDEARLKTTGFGESKPVADNDTEMGRAQNRRVELVRE